MAHRVDVPGGASGSVAEPAAAEKPHQFGLTAAMARLEWRWIDHKTKHSWRDRRCAS
jgi:hypothetical protein